MPTHRTAITPQELYVSEMAAGFFMLPSPCLPHIVGHEIVMPSTADTHAQVDHMFVDTLLSLPAPPYAHFPSSTRCHHACLRMVLHGRIGSISTCAMRWAALLVQHAMPADMAVSRNELKDIAPGGRLDVSAPGPGGELDAGNLQSFRTCVKTVSIRSDSGPPICTAAPLAKTIDRYARGDDPT